MANEFKVRDEDREGILFYMELLHYYERMLADENETEFRGFGVIEFYHSSRESVVWTYEYWLSGLVWFIEDSYRNRRKKKDKKSS